LRKPGDTEYDEAVREAALSPVLFAELQGERAGMDDDALHYYLLTERKFSDDGARRAIRTFRETMAFAKLDAVAYTSGSTTDALEDTPVSSPGYDVTTPPKSVGQPSVVLRDAWPSEAGPGALRVKISPSIRAVVSFQGGEPDRAAVQKLIRLLTVMYGDDDAEAMDAAKETPELQAEP
jgi:hypothetical protein